jgi:hypothetical protein
MVKGEGCFDNGFIFSFFIESAGSRLCGKLLTMERREGCCHGLFGF